MQTTNDQLAKVYAEAHYDPHEIDAGLVGQLLSDSDYPSARATVTGYAKTTCHLDPNSIPTASAS
jgi:hypothetical protein